MFCAIPARGGSKRLPRKNILPLLGKPMIAYSIEQALASKLFDEVYVCTEDEEIAHIAYQFGASVPKILSAELCGDLIASHIPCQHMAKYLMEQGKFFDTLVCLQPTSPLRSVDDIKHGIEQFQENDSDFLVSGTLIDPHYFHWAMTPEDKDSTHWRMYFGDKFMVERPLLPPVYRPNGSIKIANLQKLNEVGNFFGKSLDIIVTPDERSIHVGTQYDFDVCQMLLEKRAF